MYVLEIISNSPRFCLDFRQFTILGATCDFKNVPTVNQMKIYLPVVMISEMIFFCSLMYINFYFALLEVGHPVIMFDCMHF